MPLLPLCLALAPTADVLAAPLRIPVPGEPRGFALAELTGDAQLDAVVALVEEDALYLVRGGLLGGGGATTVLLVGDGPVAVAAGDLDGDSLPDLVAVHAGSQDAQVLRGAGGGSFLHTPPFALPAAPACVELAELDGDGALDLLVGTQAGTVLALKGRGDGTFDPPSASAVGGSVRRLSLGDVDGDGDLDAVVAAVLGGTRLLRNQGGLAFGVEAIAGSFGGITDWVSLFDGDQDGDLDLLWIEDDGIAADPELVPNDGTGKWPQSEQELLFIKIAFMRLAEAADLDGDGDPDFACIGGGGPFSSNDTLFLRFGAPGFGAGAEFQSIPLGGLAADLRPGDLDGDGRVDLAATDAETHELLLLANAVCPGPPTVAGVSPAHVPALAPQPVVATLAGCGLGGVTQASVAGAPAAFEVLTDEAVQVLLPNAPQLGPATVAVSGPLGAASATVDYVVPAVPLLALQGAAPLSVASGLALAAGAAPGEVVFVAVSPDLVPTVLPGLVALGIGRGGTTLSLLATLAIPPQAWKGFAAPIPPQLFGATLHFQGAVLSPALPAFPLASTAVVTGTVGP